MNLSTHQLAGQVIVAGFEGSEPPAALCELARAGALGGFILFRRNLAMPAQVAALTARLHALAPPELPLWMSVDQEGGRVARLGPPVVRLPAMRTLGEIDDPALTGDAAQVLGHQLARLGFNLDFAPVLDVDTRPDNPVIGDRSFGRDPARVIRHADAFAQGLMRAGIAACGKHFPGHGDTEVDSHLALPKLAHDRARLNAVELAPFVALGLQLPCMMTAHIVFDALDPTRPATLARRVVHELLREQLGYTGLVFSDDLEMKAITDHWGIANAACEAIAAGCDTVLICSRVQEVLAAHAALVARAERDADFATNLQRAAARSLRTRRAYPAHGADPEQIERLLVAQPCDANAIEARIQANLKPRV